jgi:hypothetical protein
VRVEATATSRLGGRAGRRRRPMSGATRRRTGRYRGYGADPRKGVTHTRDEMLPLEHVYNVTPLKTTRKIAANTTIRPMVPKATGFDALRDSTLRTPYFSCASKYLA